MGDWTGALFFAVLIFGVFWGLRELGKQSSRTPEEFEKGAEESPSLLGAGVNALNGILNPEAGKGNNAVKELKRGSFDKKKKEGKSAGDL